MSAVPAKCIGTLIIFACNVASSVGTFVYIRAKYRLRGIPRKLSFILSAASCFSIGLFLGICFLGLYHSAVIKMNEVQRNLPRDVWLKAYPASESLLCIGFFVLWLFEGFIHALFNRLTGRNSSSAKYSGYNPVGVLSMAKLRPIDGSDDEVDLLDTREVTVTNLLDASPNPNVPIATPRTSNGGKVNSPQRNDTFLRSLMLTLAMGIHAFLESLGFGLLDTSNEVVSMGVAMILHQTLCAATLGLRLARSSASLASRGSGRRKTRSKQCFIVLALIIYLILVPLGSGIGLGLQYAHQSASSACTSPGSNCHPENVTTNSNIATTTTTYQVGSSKQLQPGALMSIVQNFAAATFLYVVFMEMLPAELTPDKSAGSGCHTTAPTVDGTGEVNPQIRNHSNLVSCLCAFFGFAFVAVLRLFHQHNHHNSAG